jgi:transcriptional regulator with GAF, ATPase, and Fis domain
MVGIAGPGRGRTVELGARALVGRAEECDLVLQDAAVSRRHCELLPAPAGVELADLGSHNGTFVDDQPVGRRLLEHGARIRIGESVFVFFRDDGGAAAQALATDLVGRTTLALSADEPALAALAEGATAGRALEALFALARDLQEAAELSAAAERLLAGAAELCGADAAAIELDDAGDDGPLARRLPDERAPSGAALLAEARARRAAFVAESLAANGAGSASAAAAYGSAVAAPLLRRGAPFGAFVLFARAGRPPFDEPRLRFAGGLADVAAPALDALARLERAREESRRLAEELRAGARLLGESGPMRDLAAKLARIAVSEATVLLLGESGTGKGVAARALHDASPRAKGPFVAVNCAALPDTLLESELFGHERGAFTGAVARRRGRLELASGGTLLLDEIGELPLALQAKLLRALEERQIERLGSTSPLRLDVRFVAATNRDLAAAVAEGSFRRDLYFRLNVVSLTLPPLRARRDDVPLLARHFLARAAASARRPLLGLSPEAERILLAHDWPGNVRELANAIERAVVLGDSELLRPEDLPESVLDGAAARGAVADEGQTLRGAVRAAKRAAIERGLVRARGNVAEAARALDVHVNHLHRLARELGIAKLRA